jgi:hypothetical protein
MKEKIMCDCGHVESDCSDSGAGRGLAVGQILQCAAKDYCILSSRVTEFGGYYDCFDLNEPEKNATLRRVECSSIKRTEDGPEVLHGQHFFVTDRVCTLEEFKGYLAAHKRQAEKMEADETGAKLRNT